MLRPWTAVLFTLAGIVATVLLVVFGWPEATPAQVVALELAPLPLQGSLAAGLWYLGGRMHGLGAPGRRALWVLGGIAGLGLGLVAVAYLGPRWLVHPGQVVTWLAVLVALLVVVAHLPRRRLTETSLFSVFPDDTDDPADPDEEGWEEAGDWEDARDGAEPATDADRPGAH